MMAAKPYTPDFIITQGNHTAYVEHFGITEDGKNFLYDEEELALYKKAIHDKIRLHKDHGTELIYTFSSYRDKRSISEHLKEELLKHGFQLNRRSDEEIVKKLIVLEENKYINRLVFLVINFIRNFKVNGYDENEFDELARRTTNVRTRLFLDICHACFLEYKRYLIENHAVDFEDMINESARVLNEVKEMREKLDFKYLIVDEYQDISRQRFDLVKAFSEVTDAKIMAVGDDWQSIYAFSGSDITLFTKFEEKMGYAKLMKIVRTYRNSQEVIDIAGNFIQKNASQIQKSLISPKHIEEPVIIYTYDNARKTSGEDRRSGANYAMAYAVQTAIEQIMAYDKSEGRNTFTSKILLLGRFGFDGDRLTRTKNRVYFIAPEKNPSEFLLEIKREYKNVFLRGKWSEEEPVRMGQKKCPVCGFPLQLKYKPSYGLKLYICTNEPEICSFMSNNLSGGKMSIMKCQECKDGYLIVKYSEKGGYFLGCSDYKKNNTGCNCTISMRDYYKTMGYVWSESAGEGSSERAKTYYNKILGAKGAEQPAESAIDNDRKKNWEQEMMNQSNEREVETDRFLNYKEYNVFQIVETVLQALLHISERRYFGVSVLTGVLRGSEAEKIAKYNLKAVAEYGALESFSREEVSTIVYWLIEKDYILQTGGQYPVLHITNRGLTYKEHLTPRNTRGLVERLSGGNR